MKISLSRRKLLVGTAAGATASLLPLPAVFGSSFASAKAQTNTYAHCLESHGRMGRDLSEFMSNPLHDDYARNVALRSNTCPHCSIHIRPAEQDALAA